MNFKFEQKKPEHIIKGVYISAIIYVVSLICAVLPTITTIFSSSWMYDSQVGFKSMTLLIVLSNILKPVAIVIFIKAMCETLFNLLKAIEIYVNKNEEV